MNANELADMIDSENWVPMDEQEQIEWEMKAATMLRQQQAEIEAVKRDNINYMNDLGKAMDEIETLKAGMEKLKDAYCERDNTVRQQQAEIEALKAVLKEAINGMGHSHQAKFKEYLK